MSDETQKKVNAIKKKISTGYQNLSSRIGSRNEQRDQPIIVKDNKSNTGKIVIGVGAVAVVGGLSYYLISQLTGAVGGSCSTPGTPCYAALSGYQKALQTCANQYALEMQNIINANKASGAGITSAQQNILNQLSSCMEYNAAQIAKTAATFKPQDPLTILSKGIVEGILIAAGLVGASVFAYALIRGLTFYSGKAAARVIKNSVIEKNVDENNITPEQASNLSNNIEATQSEAQGDSQEFMETLAEEDVISSEAATEAAAEESAAITTIDTDTENSLAGVFE